MEKALATLNKNLENILDNLEYRERDVKIEPISSGGANYTTTLFEITVTCLGKPTLDLFAKVAIFNENIRKQMSNDSTKSLYYQEHHVYEELVGLYSDLESKHHVPLEHRYVFPKLYGADLTIGEEIFIMENLTKQRFHVLSRFNSLDWEHAAVSVKDLAKFHALSLALEKEYPEAYAKFAATEMPSMESLEAMIQEKIMENIELAPEEYRARLMDCLSKNQDVMKMTFNSTGKNVLVHGDYRASNILYKRKAGKLISVPVDYQVVRVGNPFLDFHYFITCGTDEKFRKHHYNQLVDYYYIELGNALKRLDLDISQEYPRHQFDEDHKLLLPTCVSLALTILPVILVPEDAAPNMADATTDFSSFFVKPTEQYKERLHGLVKDFARWGVI